MTSLKNAVLLFAVLFTLTGIAYPLAVTAISGVAFPEEAHGSLVTDNSGQVLGSSLLGQNFTAPMYFQGRPSVVAYNASGSGGSNLGPTNPLLSEQVASRVQALREAGIAGPVPSDLVLASGSGLDPHISLESALVQVPTVAKARNLPEVTVRALVLARAVDSPIPFSGTYVNVFSLNRELDDISD